jgi:hypothetical protein
MKHKRIEKKLYYRIGSKRQPRLLFAKDPAGCSTWRTLNTKPSSKYTIDLGWCKQ